MNKMLTISVIAALGIAGGGAYMLTDSDNNYSEYVPEAVSSMLGDYLPDSLKAVPAVETSIVIEEYEQVEQQVQVEPQMQEVQEEIAVVEPQAEVELEPVAEQQEEVQQEIEQSDDNAVEIAMDEIQKSINEVSAPETVEVTSNNPKAKKLAKKIDVASMEISKLDLENKELETKFQNILRKNRELAKQLQDIDKQLANAN